MNTADNSRKEALEHAWKYFALHAEQRMAMFNYFLVLFGLVSAGLAGCLRETGALRLVGAALGVALAITSYKFWKLDQRTAFLVKHAEHALATVECTLMLECARLFESERSATLNEVGLWSYRKSFHLVFVLAGIVGSAGAALSIILFWVS